MMFDMLIYDNSILNRLCETLSGTFEQDSVHDVFRIRLRKSLNVSELTETQWMMLFQIRLRQNSSTVQAGVNRVRVSLYQQFDIQKIIAQASLFSNTS